VLVVEGGRLWQIVVEGGRSCQGCGKVVAYCGKVVAYCAKVVPQVVIHDWSKKHIKQLKKC
jgi:hypothetical protein